MNSTAANLTKFVGEHRFATILADPPWNFENKNRAAPDFRHMKRYKTMELAEIKALPVGNLTTATAHLYLWVPNALTPWGFEVMDAWGFQYKTLITWHKISKDGSSDGRGMGYYFRNVTELLLFGVKGKSPRTLAPGRRQTNLIATMKQEHSRKPEKIYRIVETCSWGPFLELFARGPRPGWASWGDQAKVAFEPDWLLKHPKKYTQKLFF